MSKDVVKDALKNCRKILSKAEKKREDKRNAAIVDFHFKSLRFKVRQDQIEKLAQSFEKLAATLRSYPGGVAITHESVDRIHKLINDWRISDADVRHAGELLHKLGLGYLTKNIPV